MEPSDSSQSLESSPAGSSHITDFHENPQLTEFTLFPMLPLELRLKIWRATFPRHQTIDFIRFLHDDFLSPRHGPATLYVNRESRNETELHYVWLSHGRGVLELSLGRGEIRVGGFTEVFTYRGIFFKRTLDTLLIEIKDAGFGEEVIARFSYTTREKLKDLFGRTEALAIAILSSESLGYYNESLPHSSIEHIQPFLVMFTSLLRVHIVFMPPFYAPQLISERQTLYQECHTLSHNITTSMDLSKDTFKHGRPDIHLSICRRHVFKAYILESLPDLEGMEQWMKKNWKGDSIIIVGFDW